MALTHRLATRDDLPLLTPLVDASIDELQKDYLSEEQIRSGRAIMGLDTQLIDDGTYFVIEIDGPGCNLRQSLDERTVRRLEFWSMTTMPLSEAKARLSEVADEVDRTHDRVHITRNGREYVVLISEQDLSSLEATIELLSDPAAMARVREAEDAIARGEETSADEMAELMAQRRARERDT